MDMYPKGRMTTITVDEKEVEKFGLLTATIYFMLREHKMIAKFHSLPMSDSIFGKDHLIKYISNQLPSADILDIEKSVSKFMLVHS